MSTARKALRGASERHAEAFHVGEGGPICPCPSKRRSIHWPLASTFNFECLVFEQKSTAAEPVIHLRCYRRSLSQLPLLHVPDELLGNGHSSGRKGVDELTLVFTPLNPAQLGRSSGVCCVGDGVGGSSSPEVTVLSPCSEESTLLLLQVPSSAAAASPSVSNVIEKRRDFACTPVCSASLHRTAVDSRLLHTQDYYRHSTGGEAGSDGACFHRSSWFLRSSAQS
ncbi:unnamed protein product [Pleuronectes platessa]|uniref:Uncharacterized protein n=1 Tax=Pleuronectes platessa TaxID=8262 RepID=A0A9N7YZ77_PLEPL|nr:unnamed protein product [Pleuronectes platessa]